MVFKAPEILQRLRTQTLEQGGIHCMCSSPGILPAIHTCFAQTIPQLVLCLIYDKISFSSLAKMRNLKARKFRNSKTELLLSQILPLGLVD